jgi:hypothetical protein
MAGTNWKLIRSRRHWLRAPTHRAIENMTVAVGVPVVEGTALSVSGRPTTDKFRNKTTLVVVKVSFGERRGYLSSAWRFQWPRLAPTSYAV